ncbi:MAG: MFS transporter [Acidobacteriia bacterium]|nr:MFS transporter [Terriglobia bacterium]
MNEDIPGTLAGATTPEAVSQTAKEKPHLARWALLIGAGVFATTMSQPAVLRLPFQNLLKADLHVSRQAMASFFAVSTLAWYFKPLAGIFTDSVPIFGTRRKHYLILSAIAAGALYLIVGIVPRTYTSVLLAMIAVNVMLVIGSTVVGGVAVEIGQREGATGRLNSARYFVMNACTLIGGPLGGFLAARAFGLTAVAGAVIALSVVPFAWLMLKEPPLAHKSSQAWINAKAQFGTLMQSKTLWSAAGLLFLVYIAPGFSTPLYYFQTDTLKLSQPFIGTLILLSGAFGIVGAGIYAVLCRRLNLRTLLYIGIIISTLTTLCFLFYRSATAAVIIESQNGLIATVAELALMDLAARATPRGSEGLGFALMMSVRNGGQALSDIFGSWLIDQHHVSFFKLVWLNAGTTALILLVIPFLPRLIIDHRDVTPRA